MIRKVKKVYNNLLKLTIAQNKDELVVYKNINDFRQATLFMRKTFTR